jgi:hypothetical protein
MNNETKAWTGYLIGLSAALWIAFTQSGCMQVLGVKHLNAWGLEIDSTQGFDVSAGVMQYDGADNQKSMNLANTKGGKDGRY